MLGLPSVLLVVAENQEPVARELGRMGIAVDASSRPARDGLGESVRELLVSGAMRAEMSQLGRDLVDGRGAERVVASMQSFAARPGEYRVQRTAAGTGVAV